MKNEEQKNQNGQQDQPVNKSAIPTEGEQQQKKDDWTNKSTGKPQAVSNMDQASSAQSQENNGNERSNISVGNDGKIASADQWQGDPNRRSNDQTENGEQYDQQIRNDRSVTEPGKDGPAAEPGKTDKKFPPMGQNQSNEKK
ncbi:MAG: hypothetical protein ABIU63_08900 [Chitinophagaceae bacterium]